MYITPYAKKKLTLVAILIVGIVILVDAPNKPYTPEDKAVIKIREVQTAFGEPTSIEHTVIYPTDEGWEGWYAEKGSSNTGELIRSTENTELNDYYLTEVSRKRSRKVLQRVRKIQEEMPDTVSTTNRYPPNHPTNASINFTENAQGYLQEYTCRSSVTNDSVGLNKDIKIKYPESSNVYLDHTCRLANGGSKYRYRTGEEGEYSERKSIKASTGIAGSAIMEAKKNATYYELNRVLQRLIRYAAEKL